MHIAMFSLNGYKTKSKLRALPFANLSITASTEIVCSRWMFIKANPVSRCSVILDRNHVFNRRSVEKLLSAVATLTGNVNSSCSRLLVAGYNSLSHSFSASDAVSGNEPDSRIHLDRHRSSSAASCNSPAWEGGRLNKLPYFCSNCLASICELLAAAVTTLAGTILLSSWRMLMVSPLNLFWRSVRM